MKKHGLEISQPAVEAYWEPSFSITKRRNDTEVHGWGFIELLCLSMIVITVCYTKKEKLSVFGLINQIHAMKYCKTIHIQYFVYELCSSVATDLLTSTRDSTSEKLK